MPFFDQGSGPRKVNEFDLKCANLLYGVVVKYCKLKRRYNRKQWAAAFADLREKIGEERIRVALDFYSRHFMGDFIPRAYSAHGFVEKFEKIEDAMRRQPISIIPKKYLAQAKQGQRDAGDLHWPNDEKADELVFIQSSLSNYHKFLADLDKCSKLETITCDLNDLAQYVLYGIQADAREFVVMWWLPLVHRIAWQWERWDGNLKSWIFRPSHSHYQKWIIPEIVLPYNGDRESWVELLKYL